MLAVVCATTSASAQPVTQPSEVSQPVTRPSEVSQPVDPQQPVTWPSSVPEPTAAVATDAAPGDTTAVTTPATTTTESAQDDTPADDEAQKKTWGALSAGTGMLLHRSTKGELWISAYALIRYLNQMPAGQTFVDHLGRPHDIDARNDIWAHRIMVHFKGWLGVERLVYQLTLWTVNTTDQKNLFAAIGYRFHRAFNLYGGLNALPGTRTLTGSHPYWLGHDRLMADEYFRTYFTHGVWANGEVVPGLWYQAMVGNNLSALGVTAAKLTRNHAYSASIWYMPTTGEFGPNGGFDDYDYHEHLATRFGVSGSVSREDRFLDLTARAPENTTIRLADSLNVFELGALAPDVSVLKLRYRMFSADAGLKYKGIFLQGHYFLRDLSDFKTDGPIPVQSILDQGFYAQAAFYPVKQKLELYGATSWIFGDKDAGFASSHEYLGGANWFFAHTKDIRLNGQLIWMDRSPVSSSFGYYVGGLRGWAASLAVSINF